MTPPHSLPRMSPLGRLPGLDLLRGVAAACVVGLHVEWIYGLQPRFLTQGYLAVDLFFMLSGYVMARTYEPRFAQGLAPLRFLAARYRRLWPIMAIGGLIGLPKLIIELRDPTAIIVGAGLNLLLLPIPAAGVGFPLNIPAWSIFFELTANLIHALVLWRLGGRWLFGLAALMVPIMVWIGLTYGTLDVGAHSEDFLPTLARAMLSYLIGIVLWRWWRDDPKLDVPPILAFVAMPIVFVATAVLLVADWRADLLFIVVVCPLMLAGGLHYRATEGAMPKIAGALGALSFPLYAVHMPVIQSMGMLLGQSWIAAGLAALGTGIAVAVGAEAVGRWRKQRRRMGA